MTTRITIVGDGAMATTCAVMLAENGHFVRMWSAFEQQARQLQETRRNEKFLPEAELPYNVEVVWREEDAFAQAEWILSAVPTQYTRRVWQRLAEYCPAEVPICSVTKGIENDTLLRPTEIIRDVLQRKNHPVAVLSGPSIAPEIIHHLPATVSLAAEDDAHAETLQALLSRPYFRVYTNSDLIGVELAGATKNVIAIAAGILDGMDYGDNAKAAMLTRGLAEIARLGNAAGAQAETFYGLAGVGDLVTTCISPVGRNRSFGEAVGRGKSVQDALEATESVVEGVATCRSVVQLARSLNVPMPLTESIHAVLFEGKDPREAVADLMNRPLTSED